MRTRTIVGCVGLLLLSTSQVQAACPGTACLYWVDGGCVNTGDGTQKICAASAGGNGPFKTIQAAIDQAITDQPGANNTTNTKDIAIEVRGSTPYNESISLLGSHELRCSDTHPCVLEGCAAANCGSDEIATNSGLLLHNDWTSAGGGVYYRTMEARIDWPYNSGCQPGGGNGVVDQYDPGFVVQGSAPDDTRAFIPSSMNGINDSTPAAGRWSYVTATNRLYVHLADGSDPTNQVWVPDHDSQLGSDGYSCVYTIAGIANLTIRRFVFEGARIANWDILNHAAYAGRNFTVQDVTLRYATYQNFFTHGWYNLTMNNVKMLYIMRGSHDTANTTGNGFHFRAFDLRNATLTNITTAHGGESALINGGCTGSVNSVLRSLDASWGDPAANPYCHYAAGMDIKHSINVTINNYTSYDNDGVGIQFDSVDGATLNGGYLHNMAFGVNITDSNYNNSPPAPLSRNLTVTNVVFDNLGQRGEGAIVGCGAAEIGAKRCQGTVTAGYLGDLCSSSVKGLGCLCTNNSDCSSGVCAALPVGPNGDFYLKAYNNFFSRISFGGVELTNNYSGSSTIVKGIYLWNNTFWEDQAVLGYGFPNNTPLSAIRFMGAGDAAAPITAADSVEIKNNIFKDVALHGLHLGDSITATNFTVDSNLYQNSQSEWTVSGKVACTYTTATPSPIKWNGTCYGTNAFATFQSDTGQEAHGLNNVSPMFVNTAATPPNLHLQTTSAAKDIGLNLGTNFTTDIDGDMRPPGLGWDIGADEYSTAAVGLVGDLDGNGVVDILDLQRMVNCLLGIETDAGVLVRADLDGVGGPTILDLQRLVNLLLGV